MSAIDPHKPWLKEQLAEAREEANKLTLTFEQVLEIYCEGYCDGYNLGVDYWQLERSVDDKLKNRKREDLIQYLKRKKIISENS